MNSNLNKLVRIGYLSKPRGLKGELKVVFFNEDSRSLKNNQIVFLVDAKRDTVLEKKVENISYREKNNMIKFFEIDNRDHAEKLRGLSLDIPRKDFPILKDDEFYLNDLIGFNVYDNTGNKYGVVINTFQFPANNVLAINYNNKEQLIPLIDDIVIDIKHKKNEIIINPIPGLFN